MAKKNIPYDQKYYDPEIECMPRPELEKLQLERLQAMVKYAYENTVYYKRSFDEAGVKPEDITSLADIEKFPFIDKKTERETQHVGSFFGEMCSVPEEDVVFMATSSGSTGVPTVSPFTQEDFDLWQSTEARLFWQAGMRPNDRYVHGLNFALYVGGPDVMGAQELGALAIWVGAVPSDRLLFVLKQYQPTVIWTSPSYAWALGEKAKEKGFDPREDFGIHTIIVAGEPGGSISSTREAIEDLWGAKVVDFFGLSDIYGACAAMCEAKDGLHIVEDQILVETVDPTTGEVLEPGSVGELTYTTLMKKARPMIRFRTGDIGKGDLLEVLLAGARVRLAELADARRTAAARLVHEQVPHADKQHDRDQIRQDGHPPRRRPALDVVVLRQHTAGGLRINEIAQILAEPVRVRQGLFDGGVAVAVSRIEVERELIALETERLDLFLPEQGLDLGIGVFLLLHRGRQIENDGENDHADQHIEPDASGTVLVRFQIKSHPLGIRIGLSGSRPPA